MNYDKTVNKKLKIGSGYFKQIRNYALINVVFVNYLNEHSKIF